MRTTIHRIGRAAAAAAFAAGVCATSAALGPACGTSEEYGYCTEPWECVSTHTYLPGSNCTNNRCACSEGEVVCCERGSKKCNIACRPPENCEPDGGGLGGDSGDGADGGEGGGEGGGGSADAGLGGGEGGSGGSGAAPPECIDASDCKGPPDPRCGEAICEGGVCGLTLLAEPGGLAAIASQKKGDCLTVVCDALGYSYAIPDPGDLYNDSRICTVDMCGSDGPVNLFVEDGMPCPEGGSGYCLDGECVECIGYLPGETQNCGIGQECDYIYCVPSACTVNSSCGDSCKPCSAGFACDEHADCKDGVCSLQGMCALPTCSDGAKNDGETDVDCGATQCLNKCGDGKGCATEADCESGVCWVGVCQAPSCSDGVQNGSESGVDCGGGGCEGCP